MVLSTTRRVANLFQALVLGSKSTVFALVFMIKTEITCFDRLYKGSFLLQSHVEKLLAVVEPSCWNFSLHKCRKIPSKSVVFFVTGTHTVSLFGFYDKVIEFSSHCNLSKSEIASHCWRGIVSSALRLVWCLLVAFLSRG